LGEINPNSLFLSHRQGELWQKLQNLAVQTGSEVVLGDLQVINLVDGVVIGMGGGDVSQDNPFLVFLQTNLEFVILGGVALVLILGITVGVLVSRVRSARARR
jgi:hypothetical protein